MMAKPLLHKTIEGAVVAALMASCGGKATVAPPDESRVSEADFCAAMAHAECDGLGSCCRLAGHVDVDPDCYAKVLAATEKQVDAARAAGARYDDEAGARCVAARAEMSTQCLTYKGPADGLDACNQVHRGGNGGVGDACDWWTCAESAEGPTTCLTQVSASGAQSRCVVTIVAADGEPCGSSAERFAECASGLICSFEGCRPFVPLGEPCVEGATGDLCEPGATCDFTETKRCVAANAPGEACSSQFECEGYSCVQGRCTLVAPATFGLCTE